VALIGSSFSARDSNARPCPPGLVECIATASDTPLLLKRRSVFVAVMTFALLVLVITKAEVRMAATDALNLRRAICNQAASAFGNFRINSAAQPEAFLNGESVKRKAEHLLCPLVGVPAD